MIRTYFKLAFRSLLSQGHQSIIAALGLSVALSCSIMILLYVHYEFSYDRYHKNADHIFRIVSKQPGNVFMGKNVFAVTPGPLKEALVNDIPEVKYATKCDFSIHTLEYNSNLYSEKGFLYADTDFLKIFTFPVVSGNPAEALKEPFTLFITKEMASKYFANEDPIGKTIKADNKYLYTVRGVMENIPRNSHFHFDFLTGFETFYSIAGGKVDAEQWDSFEHTTYIQLVDNATPDEIKVKLNDLVIKYLSPYPFFKGNQFILEPLKGIHLGGNANFEIGNNSDIRYIYLIFSMGIVILLIACFNYTNMATARSYNRGREIGVLKVVGSSKSDLIIQFLIESVLLSFGGLIFALIIVFFLIPVFSGFIERPLTFNMIFEYSALIKVFVLALATGIFAGIYPALHLASISPLNLIKEDFKNIGGKRRSGLRNLLVVFQYSVSIVALVCTFTVLGQLNFIENTDLGFVKDNIITVDLKDPVIRKNPEVLLNVLRENPKIVDIATSVNLPVAPSGNSYASWEGKPEEIKQPVFKAGIGNNFIDFYKLKIIAGRGFSNDYSADTAGSFIINQTAAKIIGWDDPVGKKFGFSREQGLGTVVGVIKDFHFQSLHLPVEPLAFSPVGSEDYRFPRYISIKVNSRDLNEAKKFVEEKIKEFSPNYLNPVSLLSDRIDEMYKTERKMASILLFATVLAVILTCLGQYSLTSYTTKSRTKEMVIRKVMGSQPSGILALFGIEMAKWIVVSLFLAWPISCFLMNKWLQSFAYHIKIDAGVFLLSLLISMVISLISVSYHVIKISKVNPAEMIRHE
jgi:putative ABC transport system permease protein